MRKFEILIGCSLFLILIAVSCKVAETPSSTLSTAVELSTLEESPPKEAWQMKWEEVLKGTKKEGKVVVFISAGGEVRDTMVREFTKKYGLQVEAISATGGEFATRILAERRAWIYGWDVYQAGITTAMLTLKPAGSLDPLEPTLILPEVTNPKAWWKGELHFVDKDRSGLNWLAYPSTPLAININLVKPEEMKSYNDLINPKWKGKMTMIDPTRSGPGGNLVGVQGDHLMGYDWLRQLAKQEPLIIRDWRLQIEWLATGKYPIAISPDTTPLYEFQKEGAPVMGITPKEGTHVTGGHGTLALINRAPHPNAAKLYINWLLSREGQEIYTRVALVHSGRVDISTDFLPQGRMRQPGVNYVDQASEAYTLKHPEYFKIGQEIFGHLLK